MISLVHPSRGHITQFYGATQVDGNPHAGQDYAYSNGREIFPEVFAAADGVVLFAGDSRGLSWPNIMYLNPDFDRSDNQDSSAGNYTILGHYVGGRMVAMTGYGHQENVWVQAGQAVSAGQRIGTVGETGFSAGKHLHFDLVLAPFVVNVAPYYGRVNPNGYFTTGTTYNLASGQLGSTTTTLEEDDMPYSEADLTRIVKEAIDEYAMTVRRFPEDRNLLDQLIQIRADAVAAKDAANSVAGNVLYNERVDGRNLFDWLKQLRADVVGIQPGSVDVAGIAKALAEQLPQADAEALVDALAARLGGSK